MTLLIPVTIATILLCIIVPLLRGPAPGFIVTPILLFVAIDLAATWPPMLPTGESVLISNHASTAVLVTVGVAVAVITFTVTAGSSLHLGRWRDPERQPTPSTVAAVRTGLFLLVILLVGLGVLRFGGTPPMLVGGFSTLLDPANSSEQVARLSETRTALTKGSVLLGEEYRGQGALNTFIEVGWMAAVSTSVLLWSWRRDRSSIIHLVTVCLLCFIFLASTGQRSPVIFAGVAAVTAASFRYRLTPRHVAALATAMLALLLLIMPLSKGERGGTDLEGRVDALWSRVTDGNGKNSAHVVNLVDTERLEPFHGRLLLHRTLAALPGGLSDGPFAYKLGKLVKGSDRKETAYLTPTQFGMLYAEGGYPVVILGYGLSGALLALLWRRLLTFRSLVPRLAAPALTVVGGKMAITGAPGMLAASLMVLVAAMLVSTPAGIRSLKTRDRRLREVETSPYA